MTFVGNYGNRSSLLEDISPEKGDFGVETGISTYENAEYLLIRIINFVLWFLGLAMLVMMIYAAYTMMTAAGNDDQFGKGKKIMTGAIIGFLVVIASYSIIFTIMYASDLMAPRFLDIFKK